MPLMFDMPLEELYQYRGCTPRPDDFDSYWENALKELQAVDSQVELVPADFHAPYADCYHLYFTGVGGARVHAKLLHPKGAADPHPAVLIFHGYSGNSGDWSDHLAMVAAGMTVAALDCRGQGGLSEDVGGVGGWTLEGHIVRGLSDAPEKMLYRQIFLDTVQLARIVMEMPQVDSSRIGATGRSQGGALTVACVSLVPEIKRAAPVFPFLSDYQRVWKIDLAKDAYVELQHWFRRFDPLHQREQQVFTQLGYIDIQNLAPRIKGQVMWFVGLMDKICPPSTQFAAYNKISSQKALEIYPDYGHEELPGCADAIFQFMLGL
ncbi:MAG: acetylxylan esterase [Anaerolineales bacterium]|nr:acetylxylan esterase [Anaerolineales bacterium]